RTGEDDVSKPVSGIDQNIAAQADFAIQSDIVVGRGNQNVVGSAVKDNVATADDIGSGADVDRLIGPNHIDRPAPCCDFIFRTAEDNAVIGSDDDQRPKRTRTS